jgi:hypothetical protein
MRKKAPKTILALFLLILPIGFATAGYTPALSLAIGPTFSQNRTIANNELPLRTSFALALEVNPLYFTFKNGVFCDLPITLTSNAQTIVWNNTVLQGFAGLQASARVGKQFDFYALALGAGVALNRYEHEDNWFFSLSATIDNSFFFTKKFSFILPIEFIYRRELFDYRIKAGLRFYPLGGKI